MKNLLGNIVLFFALSIIFSGLISCTKTTTSMGVPVDEATPTTGSSTGGKKTDYPSAPSGVMQTEIKDLDGNTFKLEDKKGKVVLVNLWATWCGPCRAEMPDLIELQDKYRDKNFEVLGLNADDESADDIKAFAEKMKLNYQLGYAQNHLRSEMIKITQLAGIPQSILINREGQLTGVFTGGGPKISSQMKESVEKAVNE